MLQWRVYLSYFDESESYDKNLVVVAGLLAKEPEIRKSEQVLAFLREFQISDEHRDKFTEFHTSDLYSSRGVFKGVDHADAMRIIGQQSWYVGRTDLDICYAVLDVKKHKEGVCGNANPVSVAFRACALEIESMISEEQPNEMAIAVFDECKPDVRREILLAFRDLRKPLSKIDGDRGQLEHFHDDLYFGSSAFSVGLQITDLCAFLARRHEEKAENTEAMFGQISHLMRRVDALHAG